MNQNTDDFEQYIKTVLHKYNEISKMQLEGSAKFNFIRISNIKLFYNFQEMKLIDNEYLYLVQLNRSSS